MMNIDRHIQYLIMRHDCVILPGWGALIAQRRPARMEDDVIYPPQRIVGFNPSVNHNDGMIASSIVRREGVSYENASSIVARDIASMHARYEASGKVVIPRIGAFERDANGSMIFTPAVGSENIASAPYYGLGSVALHRLTASMANEEDDEGLPDNIMRFPRLRTALRIAASVAILVLLGVTLSTPIMIDRQSVGYASISCPPVTESRPVVLPAPDENPETAELCIAMPPADATATVDLAAQPAAKKVLSQVAEGSFRMEASDPFYLIVGSLDTRANAEIFVGQNPQDRLVIIESGGRFRVYAATGTSYAAARKPMQNPDFAKRHPEAWVLRR